MPTVFPSVFAIDSIVQGSAIKQMALRHPSYEGECVPFTRHRLKGLLFRPANPSDSEILIVPRHSKGTTDSDLRIVEADTQTTPLQLDSGMWRRHPLQQADPTVADCERKQRAVLASWKNAFSYFADDPESSRVGLRGPQIGAVHALHAHWATSDDTATIVMPTGTGKTETMLAILVSAACDKLLVIVPSDVLRTQLSDKFVSMGILKAPTSGVLADRAQHPIVCALKHVPRSVEDLDEIARRAQVVVTTNQIASQCDDDVQERFVHHFSHCFIDEAHHSEAPKWSTFKTRFARRRVVQFTATPFREDGRLLDGHMIFRYPLRRAQQEGYFKPIAFRSVREFNPKKADEAIAAKAIEQLQSDFDKGHILMARVDNTARAREVFGIYRRFRKFNPVQFHTGLRVKEREATRKAIANRETRIVVCVNMLSEGFDLPELKIAAFHDIRKSLAITLQLAGRFTRTRDDLGDATFIANTADVHVRDELRRLYARDPDWNVLLPQLNDAVVDEQQSMREFLAGFTHFADEIPLKTVRPATSMVAYRTSCDEWKPDAFRAGIFNIDQCERVESTINEEKKTLVVVTARRVPLEWSDVEQLFSWQWDLYVVVWSAEQQLLFINGSTKTGEYRALAEAIAGDTASLIKGQEVFRSFAGVKRLRLQNVGLSEQLGRHIRYTGRMGADVEPGVPEAQRRRTSKSVLSGSGFEAGAAVTVGASRKGRIWSHQRGTVDKLATWCKYVGSKLIDGRLDPDEILRGTLKPRTLTERPDGMPIAVDWPDEMYMTPEENWSVLIGDEEHHFSAVDLEIVSPSLAGSLRFAVATESSHVEFELKLFEDDGIPNYAFEKRGEVDVHIRKGANGTDASSFFYAHPPVIWFADGALMEGHTYVPLEMSQPAFDVAKIDAWNWDDTDIRRESQGPTRVRESVQARVIRQLQQRSELNVIFDDDGKGEAADIVTVQVVNEGTTPKQIEVEFYHCKFSQEHEPGARITDLYEVCGQAQKSIHWMRSPETKTDLLTHLLRRESMRRDASKPTRFERGDDEVVETIREISRVCPLTIKVFVVQPGVSKAKISTEQLHLLSVTENHVFDTYNLSFGVVTSA